MADYYPLLSRAIRNLPDNSPEARQAIFLRARDALERQLRSVTPRLTDADIVRELLGLEDVIKRIDREMEEEAAVSAAAFRQTQDAVAKLTSPEPSASEPQVLPAATTVTAEKVARDPDAPEHDVPVSTEPKPGAAGGGTKLDRPIIQPSPRLKMPDGYGVTAHAPARKSAEPELPEPVAPLQPAQRIKLPDGSDERQRKKRLGLFAAGGLLAIIAMATIAFFNRERPDRYQASADGRQGQSTLAQDAAKREGRLTGEPGPQSPVTSSGQPEVAPQRQVTSVPIQAPVNPAPAPQASVSQPSVQPQPAQPALPVVSRAYMILESPGRSPNQYEGQANWSFVPDPASRSPQKALRATIEFGDAGLSLDVSMAPATDRSLNASHIVTVAFTPRAGEPGVREMSAVEWREREGQVGTTLAGTLVPIQDNFFMIGLDATEAGKTRNLGLLRTQRWMVFEIRMTNGRRGAFLIEKGSSGEKAIAEALSVWQ
jgi:hypothetical protein